MRRLLLRMITACATAHALLPSSATRLCSAAAVVRLRGGATLAGEEPTAFNFMRGGSDRDYSPVDAAEEDEPLIHQASGRIELIIGPMFSGKSTELLRRLSRYQAAKVPLLLLKYRGDERYSATEVQTHNRYAMEALAVSNLAEAREAARGARVVGIDEGQFFEDVLPIAEELANEGKVVIIAALDGTFQREPFGAIAELVPRCERVDKLSAICAYCAPA